MTKWQEVRLGDVCDVKGGKRLPKGVNLVTIKNTHPYIRVRDLGQGKRLQLNQNYEYVDDETQKIISHYIVSEDDVLISIVGTIGLIGIVGNSLNNANLTENCVKLINLRGIDKDFLYYFLISNSGQDAIKQGTVGAVQAKLPIKNIQTIQILLPPLDVQKKIAGVLGALDDKIELNNRINNNLEQQAQALFNEKILNNPKQGCIGDYCSIKSGFAFKSSWWQDVGVRVIKIKNIESSGLNLQECSYVSEDKISIAKDFVVKGGDLLIAMTGATIGKFAIVPHVDEILLVNQRVGKFFLGDNPLEKLPFIYCTLKQPEVVSEIINRGQGSAQPNISGNDIMSITCTYPDENIIANFNNICRPYFEKIIMNQYENTRLSALRDTLLPKLMSGEIDVSKVDINEFNIVNIV